MGNFQALNLDPKPQYKLVVFQGSDWCSNCIKLENNILSDSDFIQYLEKNNITLDRIDFPRWIKQSKEVIEKNNAIAEQYDFDGNFPTIILTTKESERFFKISQENFSSSDEFKKQIDKHLSTTKSERI